MSIRIVTMLYFYGMGKPGEFGVPNRVLHDSWTELSRPRTAWTVPGKLRDNPTPTHHVILKYAVSPPTTMPLTALSHAITDFCLGAAQFEP
jgi:hypothetical protein